MSRTDPLDAARVAVAGRRLLRVRCAGPRLPRKYPSFMVTTRCPLVGGLADGLPRQARLLVAALLAFALAGMASAGAGRLAPGDEQLGSGEYFDRFPFVGTAGDVVVIELTSSDFDPYLILIDGREQVLAQEDDSPGLGLGARITFTLPSAGTYTVIVTSVFAGETGGYSLLISTPEQIAQTPVKTPSTPGPQPSGLQPRSVSGTVVDTQGRPIAGARVTMAPALTTGSASTTTDADGRYLIEGLIDVPYNIRAWTYIEHGGRDICLRLGMESPAHFDAFVPTQGSVRNFVMQLTGFMGNTRDEIFQFGGLLTMTHAGSYASGGNRLEVSFTPTGPLIDGTTIAPFTRTIDPQHTQTVGGVPLGPYDVTVTLVGGDGSRRRIGLFDDSWGDPVDAMAVDWTGDGDCNLGSGFNRTYIGLEEAE